MLASIEEIPTSKGRMVAKIPETTALARRLQIGREVCDWFAKSTTLQRHPEKSR